MTDIVRQPLPQRTPHPVATARRVRQAKKTSRSIVEIKQERSAHNVSGSALAEGDVVIYGMDSTSLSDTLNSDSNSVDGFLQWNGAEDTWANVHNNNGSSGNIIARPTNANDNIAFLRAGTTLNTWDFLTRAFFGFNTNSIFPTAKIISATFSVFISTKTTTLANQSVVLVGSTPGTNTTLVAQDYDQTGTTAYSSTVTLANIVTGQYNDIALNATAIAAIQSALGGVFNVALVLESDRANAEPAWSSGASASITGDYTEGTNKPKLTITYRFSNGDEITTTTTLGDDKACGVVTSKAINSNTSGSIITEGKCKIKVNGTTDIAVGDYLGTYTEAGIAAKATAGDMAFAMALEAYATDDSNGEIEALVIKPRKL